MAIIQLSNLSRHYGEDETLVKALDDISLSIELNEIIISHAVTFCFSRSHGFLVSDIYLRMETFLSDFF